ncbi:MAG: choice-of-anchor Q domain-containing protein [Chloroflexota bacterium]
MSTSPAVDPANSDFQNGEESPLVCIDSWTGVHLAATALSTGLGFTPFKAAAIAADGTAHWANVELKHCRPFLEAPAALVLEPSSCTATVEIPIPRDLLDQLVLDNQIIEQIIKDPELELPTNFRAELEQALNSDFGYLSNETSGEYSNIYFIVNPIFSSAAWPSNWGELGVPEIYHFNSDVYVTAIHSGKRTSLTEVEFYAGSHSVEWTADTLIAGEDLVWIPDLSGIGAAKEKAKKETAKKTWKQTIKGWIKAAKNSAKDVYVDIAKNGAKKTKKKILKFGKKKLAKKAAKKSVGFVLDSYFLTGYTHDKTTIKFQRIYVLDKNAPSITGNTPVTVEALEPGGVSSGHHINMLKRQLNITDDCDPTPGLTYNTPRFWPLSLQEDGTSISSEISWTATDNGAASDAGGVNQTTVTQQVTVVDTKPPILVAPPPLIMEATATELMTLSLGSPQVFDVADLRPTISNDGPSQFTQGIYYINWLATDFSGNVSEATKDSVQVVNLKEPGTNNLPTAFEQTGPNALSAISFEPITITVRGQDGDTASSGDPDPLWFSIESQPEHGFFIAPLYPYFIDDYRMAARYSPQIAAAEGEEFAWQVAQSSDAMREYIKQLCEEDIRREDLPKDFVSGIDYIAVDDDGYTYIYDSAYRRCHHGDGSTVAPNGSPRISVWDQNGLYVGEQERSSDSRPLRDIKFNLGRGTIIATQSDGSSTGNSLVNISTIQPNNAAQPVVELQTYTLWNEINDIYVGEEQTRRGPEYKNAGAAAWDNTNGVLYVIGDQNQNLKGMVALKPGPCNNSTDRGPEDCLDLLGVQIYSSSIVQSTKWGDFPGVGVDAMRLRRIRDIALDTKGAVHIIAEEEGGGFHRIYKFAPATIEADGTVTLGELIGWMGKCDSGPDCDYVNGRSVGYSCTDETCLIDEGGKESGDRPGQFENAAALAFDPNDVLYVADSGNDRVQRFSSEGLFAGEARSSGDGSGFVLGDFGSPSNIAVNRGSFFILDSFREIVHVFDAAVIHGIDERSAWVEYQSENNFVGTDRFTFSATDGFRNSDGETLHSPPATVEINVTRNFRPPQATAGLAISVTEDMPTALVLEGYDIDGSLDTLTFQVVNPPADGSLSGTSPNLIYTPRENFDDEDGFFFTVSDGRSLSQPEEFLIQMIPVNDSPVLRLDTESFQAGVGFPFALQATAVDAEIDDDLTVVIDWGDGTNEGEGVAQNDGTLSGPVINESGVITRSILAYHTYRNPGTYNLTLTVTDPSGANDVIAQPIVVEEMADLALQRQGNSTASPTRLTLSYELLAINLPSSDGGITAADVQIRETLGEGLTYRLATTSSGTCAPNGKNLTCAFNALAPDAVATIRIVVDVDPALAVGTEVDVRAEISSTTSDPVPENNDDEVRMTMLPDADFLVNSPLEGNDSTLGDGLCETTEGVCTLRAAIQEANALPGKQRIALPRQTYMLNLDSATVMAAFLGAASRPSEDAAANGDLDITDDLDLIGLGADETTINANGQDRVIDVLNGAVVSIRGVALTGGKPNDEASSYGGGLRNVDGVVTLINVSVNANESLGGGGIANMGGSMEISASSITGNDAGQASGGGLLNQAQITLENVTVSGNRAGSGGGLQALGGAALLRNVTLVSNVATNAGGGINNSDAMGVRLANTIVADNIASFGPVCGFTFQSDGHNLLDNLTDCTILGETATNIIDSSFSMENLALSAASTYAHTPATDSPVIDAGRCDLETDQRGVPRPQQEQCDIGAIEMIDGEVEEIEPPKVTKNVYLPMMTQ